MNKYYYSFNQYLREKFGERVHRINLNAGCGCPNIDGTLSHDGCIFCNNKAFNYFAKSGPLSLEEQIVQSMEYARRRFKAHKFIAYFQSFSSTYGDAEFLKNRYNVIKRFSDIVGLSISTRPDCIDEGKLDLIERFTDEYEVYIEYGLQTIHDRTLAAINRNHSFADFQRAAALTAQRKNIKIAAHVILGLCGETKEDILLTARCVATMPLWGIKFHCLHVVKDTPLEEMYKRGEVNLLSEDEYIDILITFFELIPKHYVVLRLVSDADRGLLIAPLWVNDKQGVLQKIEEEFKRRNTWQGKCLADND